jgi:hypothetical protein
MGKGSYGYPGLRNASHLGRPTRNINSNTAAVRKEFGLTQNGYIAQKSKTNGKTSRRVYYSTDPLSSAKKLFSTIGKGGVQSTLKGKDGEVYGWTRTMKGGDIITYRARKSSDGSSVIDIYIHNSHTGIRNQKIHFYKKENK